MARPKNKTDLLDLSEKNFQKLFHFIEAFDMEKQEESFPPGTMNRNIRDVLIHLHQWHLMMAKWYKIGMSGEKPAMPDEGYTWKTVPALNKLIWEEAQAISLEDAKQKVSSSHKDVRAIIEKHSDEELFEKKRYKWTGSTSLGAYLISATSSHYDWAFKLIKKANKRR